MPEPEEQVDKPVPGSPFHPAYGAPDTFRLRVLRYAEIHGVKAARQAFDIRGNGTIYAWRKRYKNEVETGG